MKTDNTLLNLFVVLVFVFINPFYAVSICAILNFTNLKMNFLLFSIMFASSFGLFFFIRDWNLGNDAIFYLNTFQRIDSYSLTDFFFNINLNQTGIEPLWYVFLWFSRIIIGNHVDFFAFFILFTIFFLTAYLGKVIDEKKFVVVIACILFVNGGFFGNVWEVWRHTFGLLLFFIGIFFLEADRNRHLARGLMYSAALIHIVFIPILASYEILSFLIKKNARSQIYTHFQSIQKYSIQIVVYSVLIFVIFVWSEKFLIDAFTSKLIAYQAYQPDSNHKIVGYAVLLNPVTVALIYYFWFNRKKISTNDVFIGINYFMVICAFITQNLPSALGRFFYVFLVGVTILCGKLLLVEKKQGFLFLVIFILFMFYSYDKHGGGTLLTLVGGNFLNPSYGLLSMISNYSEFLVPPSSIL